MHMTSSVADTPDQSRERNLRPAKTKSWSAIAGILKGNTSWVLLIVILNLAFFGDALFTEKTFFFRDVSFFHYPLKKLVTEAYSRGEWPLWNPYIQLGQPLLANPNAMAFYPTQILFQILPFNLAIEVHFVLHCILAGLALFFFSRELGLSHYSAFVAAILYNFSGVTLSFVNLFNILPAVAFMPLLSLALLRLLRAPSLRKVVWTSFVLGCFFLLLEPATSIAIALFLVPFLITYFLLQLSAVISWKKALGLLVAVGTLALLLAAIQLLPTFELIQRSGRRGGLDFDVINYWSMHPINLIQVLFPGIFGDFFKLANPTNWGKEFFENREPYLLSCYLGIFPLVVGVIGVFFKPQRWLRILLVLVAGTALLLALGKYTPIYGWLFRYCPLFRYGRYPVKFLLGFNFCFSLLVGLGLEELFKLRRSGEEISQSFRCRWGAGMALVLLMVLLFSILSIEKVWLKIPDVTVYVNQVVVSAGSRTLAIGISLIRSAIRHGQVHAAALLIFLGLLVIRQVRTSILQCAVAFFIVVDLFTSNLWINPLTLEDFYETPPTAKYVLDQMKTHGLERVYRFQDEDFEKAPGVLGATDSVMWISLYRKLTLYQFLSAADHIHFAVFGPIDRMETLPSQIISRELRNVKTLEEKLNYLAGLNVGMILSMRPIDSPLLSLDGVFRINSEKPLRIYRLKNRLPRTFVVADARPSQEEFQSFESYLALDSNRSQPMEGDSTHQVPPAAGGQANAVRTWAHIRHYEPNQIEMQADSGKAGELILLDSYFPGWHGFVDGKETPVKSINFVFRGVSLPAGTHHVTFRYYPDSFRRGLWISAGGVLIWMTLFLIGMTGSIRTRLGWRIRSHFI
jgi:hypothetical protein